MVEQVVVGKGAISAYTAVAKMLKLRQESGGSFTTYQRVYMELREDIVRQGNAEEVLGRILDCLFVLGLDQDQFKDKLIHVYGSKEWPKAADLAAELHEYAEYTSLMEGLKRDNNEGRVTANVTTVKGEGTGGSGGKKLVCYNCKKEGHKANECVERRKLICFVCKREGHKAESCPDKELEEREERKEKSKKKDERGRERGERKKSVGNYKKSNKAIQRGKFIKKVTANISEMMEQGWREEDEDDDDVDDDDDNDDEVEEEGGSGYGYVVDCDLKRWIGDGEWREGAEEKEESVVAMLSDVKDNLYFLDSCCNKAHVVTDRSLLVEEYDPTRWKHLPTVRGISGHELKAVAVGSLGPIPGLALVVPDAEVNLLSVMAMV
jgi:hypothetical protein